MTPDKKIVIEGTKVYFAIIKGSSLNENRVNYRVSIEGYHTPESDPTIHSLGIQVVNGSNSFRYKDGERVLVLVRNNDYSKVYLIGKVGDPYSDEILKPDPAINEPGTSRYGNDKNGIYFKGEKGSYSVLYSGSTSLTLDTNGFIFKNGSSSSAINDKGISLISSGGSLILNREDSYIISENDLTVVSKNGGILFNSSLFLFDGSGGKASFNRLSDFAVNSGKALISAGYVKIVGMSASAYSEGSVALDLMTLEGDIALSTGKGDILITATSPNSLISIESGFPANLSKIALDGASIKIENELGLIKIEPEGSIEIKGALGSTEKSILGETLVGLLEEIIDEINKITVPTAVGPSGTPSNSSKFTLIKQKLNTALSLSVKNN